MEQIKTLANCSDEEGLVQMYLIAEDIEKWIKVTDILSIRKKIPKLDDIPEDIDEQKKASIKEKNDKKLMEQGKKNMMEMFKVALKEHPKETARIMRLCCFTDPEDNSHSIFYYMRGFTEMLQDENVVVSFLSLPNMAQMFGLTV